MKRYVLGITGATGPVIGLRVLWELARTAEVHVIISRQSFSIIFEETGADLARLDGADAGPHRVCRTGSGARPAD